MRYRACGHNHILLGHHISALEIVKIRRRRKCSSVGLFAIVPVEPAQPFVQLRVIVSNHLEVAFECAEVGRIEAYKRREESDVGL